MSNTNTSAKPQVKFFDGFTKIMLAVMVCILLFIFVSAKFMTARNMGAEGTDGTVNDLATTVSQREHHPFLDLPGDAEVGAFSVANFFAGLIVGHNLERLFGKREGYVDPNKEDKAITEKQAE